jgi:hypothetical protein
MGSFNNRHTRIKTLIDNNQSTDARYSLALQVAARSGM